MHFTDLDIATDRHHKVITYTALPAPRQVELAVCVCGAVVADQEAHELFHAQLQARVTQTTPTSSPVCHCPKWPGPHQIAGECLSAGAWALTH